MARNVGLWARLTGRTQKTETPAASAATADDTTTGDDTTEPIDTSDADAEADAAAKKKAAEDQRVADDAAAAATADDDAATEPEPSSREMFDCLRTEFGAAFAIRAFDANLSMQEAVSLRLEETTAANTKLAAENAAYKKREQAYMIGEDEVNTTATDDTKKQERYAVATELEKRGLSKGRASFAAYIEHLKSTPAKN